jgi:leader peptidase (prepilin peptidase)/N-methyltransferase
MFSHIFDPALWAAVPFHFWSVVVFILGTIVGSFLNVCIHRLPLGESVVSPPSHCPHCKYSIPWYLNLPLVTWLYLRGKCKNCGAPISMRYFVVELLTGVAFLACWLAYGRHSPAMAMVYAVFLAGLIAATFIDFEHFIIPDEITIGGMACGFGFSFLVPGLHGESSLLGAMKQSLLGIVVGVCLIYFILRMGKLVFGRQKVAVPEDCRAIFTETTLQLPGKELLYGDLLYRASDAIVLQARRLELVDRCYKDVRVRMTRSSLEIGEEKLDPETVPFMEAECGEIVLPREAMGLGDVKFMGAIGAFLGWKAVLFSLMVSSLIGSLVGVGLIVLRRQVWSSRLPYGPYIAMASTIWIFGGRRLVEWWFGR